MPVTPKTPYSPYNTRRARPSRPLDAAHPVAEEPLRPRPARLRAAPRRPPGDPPRPPRPGRLLPRLAGAAATAVQVSSWLLLCTIFLSLFLAFSKRRHEITLLAEGATSQRRVLHHYSAAFLDQMINVVTASSVVSYALYAVAPETVEKYHTQDLVLTIPLVLYGIFRYLYLLYQRPGARNPTEAILREPPFLINILLGGLVVVWIVYGREAGLK